MHTEETMMAKSPSLLLKYHVQVRRIAKREWPLKRKLSYSVLLSLLRSDNCQMTAVLRALVLRFLLTFWATI